MQHFIFLFLYSINVKSFFFFLRIHVFKYSTLYVYLVLYLLYYSYFRVLDYSYTLSSSEHVYIPNSSQYKVVYCEEKKLIKELLKFLTRKHEPPKFNFNLFDDFLTRNHLKSQTELSPQYVSYYFYMNELIKRDK